MTKINKIYQVMMFSLLVLFFIEMVMLFSQIDLIPFIFIGGVCGLSIILNNNSEDFFYSESMGKDTKIILRIILLSIVDMLLFCCFLLLGIESLSTWIIGLLTDYKIVRFALYGFIFPLIAGYFLTWFWTDNKPNLSVLYAIVMPNSMGTFYKILFICLVIGLLVCVFWTDYFSLVNTLLRFF